MINQQSIDARNFLSEKRNKMMTLRRVKDPGQREQFINVFRGIISSEKYKQYLEIEKEDIKIILQYEKRKKGGELTPLEFFKAKRSFYGDSPARILENLYKKPYLTLVEMKRLIKYYSESSVKHYDFRMNLGNSLKMNNRGSGGSVIRIRGYGYSYE